MTIGMIDAVAGSGKTTAMIQTAIDWAIENKRPVCVCLPTKDVIDEKYHDAFEIADGRIKVYRVHSDVCDNVGESLRGLLEEIGTHRPALLFVTHKTFWDCTNWIGRKHWKFYIDELFDPVQFLPFKLPRNYAVITDVLELIAPSDVYSEVRIAPGKRKTFEQMCDGLDAVDRVVEAITKCLSQPERWKVYVDCVNYHAVISDVGRATLIDEREKASELRFWVVQQPWFEREKLNVTMASACFTDRLLYKLWTKSGSKFVADSEINAALQTHVHDGTGLELHCMNIKHWSAWAKNGGRPSNKTEDSPQRQLEALIGSTFGEEPYIYCANSDWKGKLGGLGTQISVVQHGKNEHSQHTNVAFMPSLLPVPFKWDFLKWLGFGEDDIRDEYYHSSVYQSVFRSAARKVGRKERVRAVLPDRASCEYIKRKAPGSVIIEHPVLAPRSSRGRPRKHVDKRAVRAANALSMRERRQRLRQLEKRDMA